MQLHLTFKPESSPRPKAPTSAVAGAEPPANHKDQRKLPGGALVLSPTDLVPSCEWPASVGQARSPDFPEALPLHLKMKRIGPLPWGPRGLGT